MKYIVSIIAAFAAAALAPSSLAQDTSLQHAIPERLFVPENHRVLVRGAKIETRLDPLMFQRKMVNISPEFSTQIIDGHPRRVIIAPARQEERLVPQPYRAQKTRCVLQPASYIVMSPEGRITAHYVWRKGDLINSQK